MNKTMGNRSMTKGSVVLVPFPFDDLSTKKVRPAVCLTNPIGPHRHVVLAFITSRVMVQLQKTDVELDSTQPYFSETGLRVSSTLCLHRLMTVSTSIILRQLGKLPPLVQKEVDEKLVLLFDLRNLQ